MNKDRLNWRKVVQVALIYNVVHLVWMFWPAMWNYYKGVRSAAQAGLIVGRCTTGCYLIDEIQTVVPCDVHRDEIEALYNVNVAAMGADPEQDSEEFSSWLFGDKANESFNPPKFTMSDETRSEFNDIIDRHFGKN